MITVKTGDLLNEDVEAIVNTVNCVGVMGRGIALQFKKAFPDNFKTYAAACKREEVLPGSMFVTETGGLTNPRYIINFPTKRHWRGKSRMEDIDSGLEDLARVIRDRDINSIAIPPLGSGLGGLDWQDVLPRIEDTLRGFNNLEVIIFEPGGKAADSRPVKTKAVPKMTSGRAVLVSLMDHYLKGLLDTRVTLLEVHKLMYFMQEAGQPLRLKYKKHIYGPYADNLRHVLNAIEGHLVSGYADGGDGPNKPLALVPGALKDADHFLSGKKLEKQRLKRVTELASGFETPYGLELLATVHWVVRRDKAASLEAAISKIYNWNPRKKQFTERQIGIAYDVLMDKGWLEI